ncbi:MAG: DUF6443 domain-containing protein, partial [Mediterranea sp.]|nr:DUF6443 domain-containing protein [Mediterranea sp.]
MKTRTLYILMGLLSVSHSAASGFTGFGEIQEEPIDLGVRDNAFSYSETYQASTNFYYRLILLKSMTVTISAHASNASEEAGPQVNLCNSFGSVVEWESDEPLVCQDLPAGIHYIWVEEPPIDADVMRVEISGNNVREYVSTWNPSPVFQGIGEVWREPIYAGAFNGNFERANVEPNTSDVFYKFVTGRVMNVSIEVFDLEAFRNPEYSHPYVHLCDSEGETMDVNPEQLHHFTVDALPIGTYYIWIEGTGSPGTILHTGISGKYSGSGVPSTPTPAPQSLVNTIRSTTPTVANLSIATALNTVNSTQSVEHFDGLGRLVQSVQRAGSPSGRDLVTLQEYDGMGRESKRWLPVVSGYNSGNYVNPSNLKTGAAGTDQNPYSLTLYEPSPLKRVVKEFGPGQEWHGHDKAATFAYLTNDNGDEKLRCLRFEVPEGGMDTYLVRYGGTSMYHADGELLVTLTTDADGAERYEFVNKLGQTILVRQIEDDECHDTHFAYDMFGNLCYVLPPLAAGLSAFGDDTEGMRRYAYLYKYDERQRCIAKRLPGCDWTYVVYDHADHPVFTQSGNQRAMGEWAFAVTDALGRPCLAGTCSNELDFASNPMEGVVVRARRSGGPLKGYVVSGITLENPKVLSANYYDDYSFLGANGIPIATDDRVSYDATAEADGFGERYPDAKGLL